MKKLQTWQKVLLIIFYPVGIVYFIIWLVNKNKQPATGAAPKRAAELDFDTVFVNKGSKVYHSDQMCAMSRSSDCVEMKEKDAIKKGLRRCGKCYGNYNG